MRRVLQVGQMMLLAGLLASCNSDGNDEGGTGAGGNGSEAEGGNGPGGSGSGEAGASADGTGGNGAEECAPVPVQTEGCTGEILAGETIPVDIYVMLDQSGSMATQATPDSPTRLAQVRLAMTSFMEDPESAGIGVGIGYFGNADLVGGELTSCDPTDYATPAVPIGVLPTRADDLIASLDAISPMGETPTGAAIRGACDYASGFKAEHLGHAVVILLVTDGVPEAPWTAPRTEGTEEYCSPTMEDAVDAAAGCLSPADDAPAVATYVLGIGPSLSNLNQIAAAGGTDEAFLVEGESSESILQALNEIRAAATVPCELRIPESPSPEGLDYNEVNLVYVDAGCTQHTVHNVADEASCDAEEGGWYYDDPVNPTTINLCSATCNDVSVPGAQLSYSIGCMTIVS